MANNRIFYACQAVFIGKTGHTPAAVGSPSTAGRFMEGVQSVGITSNFTLDQAFELGQIQIYENSEEVADIEVTLEKVLDGKPLLYGQACGNSVKDNMVAAGKNRSDVYLGVYADTVSSTSGASVGAVVMCSGMYISSVSYTYPTDGAATESITLVGNDKFWSDNTAGVVPNPDTSYGASPTTGLDGSDTSTSASNAPATGSPTGSGLVRRQKVDIKNSTIPAEISNPMGTTSTDKSKGYHISSISVSADFGRESILELGSFGPYHRYAGYPIEVTAEFEVTAVSGDLVNVSGTAENLNNREIVIKDDGGHVIDLGTQNKLSSVSYSGGDTGGGNATCTYSYSTFNDLKVHGGGSYYTSGS
tara:strand:- start:2732 stop:3814 length:1083 start_codon:yes stop_codon:yes gene_type:complete